MISGEPMTRMFSTWITDTSNKENGSANHE
jgi:hypothetical protein